MNELIKVAQATVGTNTVQTVSARDLHAFLEVGKDFSNWIKDRVDQYGFLENQDFVCSPISASSGRGGHNRKDYHLTLDMAKELAMVERNEKGKQARQYFIECERKLKVGDPLATLPPEHRALVQLLCESAEIKARQSEIEATQAQQKDSIKRIEAKQSAFENGHSFFTVVGFCALREIKLGMKDMQCLGRRAGKVSREKGIPIDKVRDVRYGVVNSYHEDTLVEALSQIHGGM